MKILLELLKGFGLPTPKLARNVRNVLLILAVIAGSLIAGDEAGKIDLHPIVYEVCSYVGIICGALGVSAQGIRKRKQTKNK
jgi:hypothetical protein